MRRIEDLERFAESSLPGLFAEVRARVGEDPGHDLGHLLRVALWTVRLGGDAADPAEAVAAGLLHDIVNVPKDSPERSRASDRCAQESRGILARYDFTPDAVERICDAIRDHSYTRGAVPSSPLGRALRDADRLEAIGAIGVMRAVACGTRMGSAFFHPDDPWAGGRVLDDRKWMVDHFFRKLLLLAETMTTEEGRREARRRTEYLQGFLRQLGDELGVPAPPVNVTSPTSP